MGSSSSAFRDAVKYAHRKGAVVVWAAGNSNCRLSDRDFPEMVVVSGTDSDDDRYYSNETYGSCYGGSVDIAAPGEGVYVPLGSHRRTNGTSFSAPIVSGVIALMFSKKLNQTPAKVIEGVKASAKALGNSDYFGAGLVDAKTALDSVPTL